MMAALEDSWQGEIKLLNGVNLVYGALDEGSKHNLQKRYILSV